MNSAELLNGLRKRDPSAAQYLNECFVPSIWRFVYFRVNQDTHLAEDIVAEAVLALLSAAAAGTAIENPVAWLRTVAQRRIQDHFRAVARVRHLIEQVEHQTKDCDENDPAKKFDETLRFERVRDSMSVLPDHYRQALEWKYVDRVSVKVIAGRTGATEKSVESTLFRARQALRDLLIAEQDLSPVARSGAAKVRPGDVPKCETSDDCISTDSGSGSTQKCSSHPSGILDQQRSSPGVDASEADSAFLFRLRLSREN